MTGTIILSKKKKKKNNNNNNASKAYSLRFAAAKNNIEPIHLMQKRIIRNVTKSDFLAHSKPLFKSTNILNIYDLNKLYMGTQFFKDPNKYIDPLRPMHQHNTRNPHVLRPIQHGLSLVQNSFLIKGPKNYNGIPIQIKMAPTVHSFKRNFKRHLLSKY